MDHIQAFRKVKGKKCVQEVNLKTSFDFGLVTKNQFERFGILLKIISSRFY